ncbi:MAG: HAD-IA family hydrolase [Turicibacter sp.]|nr:HAD-IA family hydrolase [Turicibacter sp.]
MIKAVVFDLDDTLISEYEYIRSGFKVVAKVLSEKYKLSQEDVFLQLMNLFQESPKNVFNRILDFYHIDYTTEEIKELIAVYRHHLPNISLYEDAKFILNELSEKSLKLGIITDGYQVTQRNKLLSLGIDAYFDAIIVTDELGREFWKPHARPYELIKAQLDVEFNEMIYIGDNVSKDFVTAKKLGIKTIHIKRDEGVYIDLKYDEDYQADYQINSLEQVIDFI